MGQAGKKESKDNEMFPLLLQRKQWALLLEGRQALKLALRKRDYSRSSGGSESIE